MITVYTEQAEMSEEIAGVARLELSAIGPGYYVHSVVVCEDWNRQTPLAAAIAQSLEPEAWAIRQRAGKMFIVNFRLESERAAK